MCAVIFVTYDVPSFGSKFPRHWYRRVSRAAHTLGKALDNGSRSGTLDNRDRVDVVGEAFSGVAARATPFGPVPYFNARAFTAAAIGTWGNIGRDSIYGPGFGAVDFSIFKDTAITERFRVQLRAEIFNILDRANFANPGVNFNAASSFGVITNTRNGASAPGIGFGEPRNMQLALKLIW